MRNPQLQSPVRHIPLRAMLIVPFVMQLIGTVGLVGYLSYRSGQTAVQNLSDRLMTEVSAHVDLHLEQTFWLAAHVNQMNRQAVEQGRLDLNSYAEIDTFLWNRLQDFEQITTVLWGQPDGTFRAMHRSTLAPGRIEGVMADPSNPQHVRVHYLDEQGDRAEPVVVLDNFPVQERPWYQGAVRDRAPGWTQPFQVGNEPRLAISAYTPVYDAQEQLQGVFAVNLGLVQLSKFLRSVEVCSGCRLVIVDQDGKMIADSAGASPFQLLDFPNAAGTYQGRFKRVQAAENADPAIAAAAKHWQALDSVAKDRVRSQFQLDQEQYLLHLTPLSSNLNWRLAVIMPQSTFMAQITANTRRTIILCGVALVGSILIGGFGIQWLLRPLFRLQKSAEAIAFGDLDTPIAAGGVGVVYTLAKTFAAMRVQLKTIITAERNSAVLFAKLLDHVPVGVCIFAPTGEMLIINQTGSQILGTSHLETELDFLASSYQVYYSGTDTLYHTAELPAIRALQGETVHVEELEIKVDGLRIPLQVSAVPVRDEHDEIIYAIAAFEDITQQRQAENLLRNYNQQLATEVEQQTAELQTAKDAAESAQAQADAANRAKSTFLANMSHELRTPLNAILGYPQLLLLDEFNLGTRERQLVERIKVSGDYLLTLINQILDLSKIEAGRMSLNISNLSLCELLDDLTEMIQPQAEKKGLAFQLDCGTTVPNFICTDGVKLQQVLINLLNNAIKFTASGSVTLSIRPCPDKSGYLSFRVIDTGVGIAPEELKQLFNAFTQTQSGVESQEGTGLGLAISHQFVALLGGQLTVESHLGQGTVFQFDIILQAKPDTLSPETSSLSSSQVKLPQYQHPTKVLVVDDNDSNREVLVMMLENWGFSTQEAMDGEAAIEQWKRWQPDLIFMDIRLPKLTGIQVTQIIRHQAQSKSPPIVAITASAFEEDKANILAAGCDGFIRKPFQAIEIIETLTQCLNIQFCNYNSEPSPRPKQNYSSPEFPKMPLRILIAEDNEQDQDLAQMHLAKQGYVIDIAKDGIEVMTTLAIRPYDIILMDLQMPSINGLDATRMIREDYPSHEQPYIIALTASSDVHARDACLAAGMNAYLTKPLQEEQLTQVIKRCIDS